MASETLSPALNLCRLCLFPRGGGGRVGWKDTGRGRGVGAGQVPQWVGLGPVPVSLSERAALS